MASPIFSSTNESSSPRQSENESQHAERAERRSERARHDSERDSHRGDGDGPEPSQPEEPPSPGASRRRRLLPWMLFFTTAAASFALAMARYESVHNRTYDLALYARMAWGFVHGDFWSPVTGGASLGVHVSLVLFPLAALGRVLGQVPVLLLAQSLAFAAALFPMERIAARHLGPRCGYVGVLAWLAYPNLWHVTTYEFHPSNLAALPLAWAADALDREDPRALLGWGAAALACREDMGLPVALFGLACMARTRSRHGLGTLLLGAAGLGLGAAVVKLAGSGASASLDQHFGAWGGSPLGIVTALFSEPGRVLSHLSALRTLLYVPMVLAPLLLLPLATPARLLPAAGTLALNVISTFPTTTHFYSHYLTPAVPTLVAAGLAGLGQLPPRLRFGGLGLLAALTVTHVLAGGSPLARDFDADAYLDDAHSVASRAVLDAVPPAASVQAPAPLLPHLAERHDVRLGPPPETGADWVVLDLRHRERVARTETLLRMSEEPLARRWIARDDHRPERFASPWLLLSRQPFVRDAPAVRGYYREDAPREGGTPLCACLTLERARLIEQGLELELRAEGPCAADLAVRLSPAPHGKRVDLLFDGVLSPAHLREGDLLRSRHSHFDAAARKALREGGLWIGALRSSGVRPAHDDPRRVHVTVAHGIGDGD